MDGMPHIAPLLQRQAGWLQAAQLAQVVSLDDPDGRNRVQVRILGCDGGSRQDAPVWARVVCPFAGRDRGAFFIPDVDDEVLVVFQDGDPSHPLVLGGLWNGASAAPEDIRGGDNRYKVIRSKNGVRLVMDDQAGQERFVVETPGGQRVTLQDGPGQVLVEDSNGNSVRMDATGVQVVAAATVKVQAARVEVSAGMVQVDAALARFSGIVDCQVLQTTSVISASYTPGAGIVW